MQQIQEKPQTVRSQYAGQEYREIFQETAFPRILSIASKVCYGMSGASIIASVGIWSRANVKPRGKNRQNQVREHDVHHARHLGSYVNLWSSTFLVLGKVLADSSERIARHEFLQWERLESSRTPRNRFFQR